MKKAIILFSLISFLFSCNEQNKSPKPVNGQTESPQLVIGLSENVAIKLINSAYTSNDGYIISTNSYFDAGSNGNITEYSWIGSEHLTRAMICCLNKKVIDMLLEITECDAADKNKFLDLLKTSSDYTYLGNGVFQPLNVPKENHHYEMYLYAKRKPEYSSKGILFLWAFSQKKWAKDYAKIFTSDPEIEIEILK